MLLFVLASAAAPLHSQTDALAAANAAAATAAANAAGTAVAEPLPAAVVAEPLRFNSHRKPYGVTFIY